MSAPATEDSSGPDELNVSVYDDRAETVRDCVHKLRDAFPPREYPRIYPKHDYGDDDGVLVSTVVNGGIVTVQHTFSTVVPDAIEEIVAVTRCEVLHSMVSYQEPLGTTETILFIVPTEYADEYDPGTLEESYAGFRDATHIETLVETSTDETIEQVTSQLPFAVGALLAYLTFRYLVETGAFAPRAPQILTDATSLVLFVGLGIALIAMYSHLIQYVKARVFT